MSNNDDELRKKLLSDVHDDDNVNRLGGDDEEEEDLEEQKKKLILKKLVAFNNPDVSARPVADLLTNFFKREKAIQVLRDAGPEIEDLAIVLVGGLEDDDALYEACDLLARYGGEKSLSPLNDLSKRAARKGGNDGKKIAQASKDAIQIIKERLAAQREREEGGDM